MSKRSPETVNDAIVQLSEEFDILDWFMLLFFVHVFKQPPVVSVAVLGVDHVSAVLFGQVFQLDVVLLSVGEVAFLPIFIFSLLVFVFSSLAKLVSFCF